MDVSVFSVYKAYYHYAAEEWIEFNSPRSIIKLTDSQQRILRTRNENSSVEEIDEVSVNEPVKALKQSTLFSFCFLLYYLELFLFDDKIVKCVIFVFVKFFVITTSSCVNKRNYENNEIVTMVALNLYKSHYKTKKS